MPALTRLLRAGLRAIRRHYPQAKLRRLEPLFYPLHPNKPCAYITLPPLVDGSVLQIYLHKIIILGLRVHPDASIDDAEQSEEGRAFLACVRGAFGQPARLMAAAERLLALYPGASYSVLYPRGSRTEVVVQLFLPEAPDGSCLSVRIAETGCSTRRQTRRRWPVVADDTEEGSALLAAACRSLESGGRGINSCAQTWVT